MLATAIIGLQAADARDKFVDIRWNLNCGNNSGCCETEYGWCRKGQFTLALRHCGSSMVASLKDTLEPPGFRYILATPPRAPPGQRRCWLADLLTLMRPGPDVDDVGVPRMIGVTLVQLGELLPTPVFQSPLIDPGDAAIAIIRLVSRKNLVIESLGLFAKKDGCRKRLDLIKPGDTLIYDPARIVIGPLSCIRLDTSVPGSANIMCVAL